MTRTRFVTLIGVLSALAIVLYFIEFPLFIYFPSYLKIDFSDVPAILGAIAAGPIAGVAIELIKNIVHFLIRNETFGAGEIANFFAGVGFLLPVAIMIGRNKANMVLACITGAICMTVIANLMNYFVTLPIYGVPAEARMPTIINFLILFNLIKAVVVSIVTMALYSKLKPFFQKLRE